MPPKKGWVKGPDGKFHPPKNDSDMSQSSRPKRTAPGVTWRDSFVPFGDRLNFLSPEIQHLHDGKLRILPPRGEKARERNV